MKRPQYYIKSGCLVRMSDGTDWHSKWVSPSIYDENACKRYMDQWKTKKCPVKRRKINSIDINDVSYVRDGEPKKWRKVGWICRYEKNGWCVKSKVNKNIRYCDQAFRCKDNSVGCMSAL